MTINRESIDEATLAPLHSLEQRRQTLFMVLGGVFLGNALIAEMVGGKLFQVDTPWHTFTLSCGVIIWPVVFVTSDIINEYFGRSGVKRLSLLAAAVIAYAFFAVWICQFVKAPGFSPIDDNSFNRVFLQSQWIIVGSITAFLLAQLIDVTVFWLVRRRTGHRLLWLRATGSTLVSQSIDTFVVGFIGLYLPWRLGFSKSDEPFTFANFLNTSTSGYIFKFAVALAVTPLLYILHAIIDRYLGREAERIIETVAKVEEAAGGASSG
ncbi:MAG: queuosine precursor transporter [Phycisphaerales bacterium]|nr:queuosine precursor transporter [Phycisphaerales bacterium]